MKSKFRYAIGIMIIANPIYAQYVSFVGDLVARDLKGAGPLGHVGIASAPHYQMKPTDVLEALDTPPHIQDNTIDDFKSRTKYWGSKGGLLTPKSHESYLVANRIVRQYYACPEYTLTWRWLEGKIDGGTPPRPISCAIFRCDTLVNYAYAFDPGYSLPTYNTTWTNPVAIYNYFPLATDLFAPERDSSQSTTESPKIENDLSTINTYNLKDLTVEDFYQILQNSPSISKEQIINLWKEITLNEVSDQIKILFYDFISFENPSYLIDEIILQAKKETGELRHKLLVTLQAIYQHKLEKNEKTEINKIITYFKELQLQDLDKNDGGIVYRGIATLSPKNLKMKKANLTNMDKIHVNILSLNSDRTNEKQYVEDIIYNLDHPDDKLVVTASYQYFTELLINSNLKFFSKNSKQLFKKHLGKKNIIDSNESMLYTSAFIEFKAALNATISEEIPTLSYSYSQLLDPDNQIATFYGFSEFTKKKLNIH